MPSVIYLPTEIGCGSGGGIVRIHSEMKFRNSPNINSIANVESGIVRNASVILLGDSFCEIFYRDRFNDFGNSYVKFQNVCSRLCPL